MEVNSQKEVHIQENNTFSIKSAQNQSKKACSCTK